MRPQVMLVLIFFLIRFNASNSDRLRGKYKSYWYETYHELILKANREFIYKSDGHGGFPTIRGSYKMVDDTIILSQAIPQTFNNKFLIFGKDTLVELESHFSYVKRRGIANTKLAVNYPQLKERSPDEKEVVLKMLQEAINSIQIEEYFTDTIPSLIVEEYFEINERDSIKLLWKDKALILKSKEEIEKEGIEEYLIIEEIKIGLKTAMIDFQVRPGSSKGELFFFRLEKGKWKKEKPFVKKNS